MTHPHPRALEAAARALHSIMRPDVDWVDQNYDPRKNDPYLTEDARNKYRTAARAAVTAYIAALQETHALVPKKPTEAMQNAAVDEMERWGYLCDEGAIKHAYRAMIDAAPPAAQEKK
jgi:hypothetical protein